MDSDDEFVPPSSKRQGCSISQDYDRGDPTYRGSIDAASSPTDKGGQDKTEYFPASKLFEYQWPLGEPEAEFYMLQEQVKDFLDIRGIQRKYPDWKRRTLDMDERKYLVGRGVVTETQSNMGLVALCSEEVLEVMVEEYTNRYSEYLEVIREREFQETLTRKIMETKRIAAVSTLMGMEEENADKAGMRLKALQMVADFNSHLTNQRRQLTAVHIDNQTQIHHVPCDPQKVLPVPELSRYPVALIPGQYSDNHISFSPDQLKQLPLNTAMESSSCSPSKAESPPSLDNSSTSTNSNQLSSKSSTPLTVQDTGKVAEDIMKLLSSGKAMPHTSSTPGKQFSILDTLQKLLSSYSAGSSNPLGQVGTVASKTKSDSSKLPASTQQSSLVSLLKRGGVKRPAVDTTNDVMEVAKDKVKEVNTSSVLVETNLTSDGKPEGGEDTPLISAISDTGPSRPKPVSLKLALCTVCCKGRSSNTRGVPEDLIECAQCGSTVHPSCYSLPSTIHSILKTYSWQCLECKTCQVCEGPHDEDKMVFCDDCDRGYHSFCVGLEIIPSGSWLCPVCGECEGCGKHEPGGDKWKHEYLNAVFISTLCVDCSSYFRKGFYCPVCYKIYRNDETDRPMVCCDKCDKWIHTGCDGISDEEYDKLSKDKTKYICALCRLAK